MTNSSIDKLRQTLAALKMNEADLLLESHLSRAAKTDGSYADFLLGLMESELRARQEAGLQQGVRRARLPFVKSLEQFDFGFQPSIDQSQIRELRTLRFIHEASNVVLLGPPGVGKTHLGVALALEAIRAGFSAQFFTAHDLVSDLGKAAREGKLNQRLRTLVTPKVLIIDEMGYLPLDDVGATLLFQLVTARYERGSIVLTSNKSFGDWGSVFGDTVMATAVLDRLLHHASVINIRGESYRMKERRKAGLLAPLEARESALQKGENAASKKRPEETEVGIFQSTI